MIVSSFFTQMSCNHKIKPPLVVQRNSSAVDPFIVARVSKHGKCATRFYALDSSFNPKYWRMLILGIR